MSAQKNKLTKVAPKDTKPPMGASATKTIDPNNASSLASNKTSTIGSNNSGAPWRKNKDDLLMYQMDKYLTFEQISKAQLDEMARWKDQDLKGNRKTLYIKEVQKKNDLILNVTEQSRLEKLQNYEDRWPCLNLRKSGLKIRIYINMLAKTIILQPIFENITITVILLNSVTLAVENPQDTPSAEMEVIESIFLVLYTTELVLKIIGMGLVFNEGAYLRDFWGILDFIIVSSAYLTLAQEGQAKVVSEEGVEEEGIDLNALRAFRVLRPLRTITTIKGLKVLVVSVLSALPMMKQTVIVLFFFFLVFAIAGVQLLSGSLKQRCVFIETGVMHPDDILCGAEACPAETFCGKMNENPNYGVTNLDNIFYAMLMVFQCTTLEGWSDIQTMYQKTYTKVIFIYFISMVFIGAFFLMNLTLAVINASFTKSQNEAKARDQAEDDKAAGDGGEDEGDMNLDDIDEALAKADGQGEIGISEFFIAKRAAKRMIEFLRMKQREKEVFKENEKKRLEGISKAGETDTGTARGATDRSNAPLMAGKSPDKKTNLTAKQQQAQFEKAEQNLPKGKVPTKVAPQDQERQQRQPAIITEEEIEEEANLDNHRNDVKNFLADLDAERGATTTRGQKQPTATAPKINMNMMQGLQESVRNRAWNMQGSTNTLKPLKDMARGSGTANSKKKQHGGILDDVISQGFTDHHFSENASKLHEELDFEKIISLQDEKPNRGNNRNQDSDPPSSGGHPFDLSFMHEDTPPNYISDGDANGKLDLDSSIESDHSLANEIAKHQTMKRQEEQQKALKKQMPPELPPQRKETIKNMKMKLRRYETSNFDNKELDIMNVTGMSTSTKRGPDGDTKTQLGMFGNTNSKTNDQKGQHDGMSMGDTIQTQGGLQKTASQAKVGNVSQKQKQAKEKEAHDKRKQVQMSNVDETFLKMKRPKDPYEFIDKKTQKIEINPGINYKSTSQDEVFEPRIFDIKAKAITSVNQYIRKPLDSQDEDSEDFDNDDYQQSRYAPYQMKQCYKIFNKAVESDSDEDPDAEFDDPQPFETVTSIGYKALLSQLPTKFLHRRSDIIVSSTMSITLSPIDQGFVKKNLIEMTEDEIKAWVDLRQEFLSKNISQAIVPGAGYTPAYYTHSMRTTFKSNAPQFQSSIMPANNDANKAQPKTLKTMKQRDEAKLQQSGVNQTENNRKMLPGCLLREALTPDQQQLLGVDEKKLYNQQKAKYDGQMRVEKKKSLDVNHKEVALTLEDARNLRNGTYHEDQDDDEVDDIVDKDDKSAKMSYFVRNEEFGNKNIDFENAVSNIIKSPSITVILNQDNQDEIPKVLREELDLPKSLGKNEVNYTEVRIKDCNIKRKTPLWSGQDVLEDSLTEDQSEWVIAFTNAVRIWPKGFMGYIKKFRCFMKIITKSNLFGSSMLTAVLLNTVVMAMERYDLTADERSGLEAANQIFTNIFIGELAFQLLAIGFKKYVSEPMNILDGAVVLLSLVEYAMVFVQGDGGSLSAFKTIRILRTLRVLRVARLLRALESMQVIISVLQKSFSSFMYIAMLLGICCFIFALLGKTLFGGQFNFADGKPRGNFDGFNIAFVTVFQVLTMENWQTVLFDSMRGEVGPWVPAIFYIAWIFIGNFILLNLFLAILLDSFLDEDDDDNMTDEQIAAKAKIKEMKQEAREKEKIRKIKKLGMSMVGQSGNQMLMAIHKPKPVKKKEGMKGLVNLQHGDDFIVDDIEDLDATTIKEMFLDEGILKDKTNKRKEEKMYQNNYCELSCYLFTKQGNFRRFCYSTAHVGWFDQSIMFLIALNSVKLAVDTYFLKAEPDELPVVIGNYIDTFFNVCFAIECFFKIIGLGFTMDDGSYMRESWNQLDFFIVVTSLIDMSLSGTVDVGVLKILRMLRILRPLRVISHNQSMKMIVSALFDSVGAIFNVVIVMVMCWLMFAILAINLLSGKSFYCSIDKYRYHTKFDCNVAGGSWTVFDSNYDNILQAMLTLFIVSTLEGWPDIMLVSVDSTVMNEGPKIENATNFSYFYIIFILIGSFFLVNFFIGVLFLKYAEAQKAETKGYTPEHINWIALQRMVTEARVAHDKVNKPIGLARLKLYNLVTSDPFDIFIMANIVLNMIQMAMTYEGSSKGMNNFLRISNYFFTLVFFIECVLKLVTYQWSYFQTAWNKFDFFVVVSSVFDFCLEFVDAESMKGFPIGNVAKVLRVLRVSRVLRLAGKNKNLQALIQTITMSVGALVNVLGLVLLILFMFAVLGVFFFNTLTTGEVIDPNYKNFQDFGSAYLLLFAIATGEDWNKLMYDCVDTPPDCVEGETCGTSFAAAYYILFILVITHIMLNLFILVIIQQFETYYVAEDNPIKTFTANFDVFHECWVKVTDKFHCIKMKERQLVDFFKEMPIPIGMKVQADDTRIISDQELSELKKQVLKMGIRSEEGWIYFNELLYRCMRRVHGNFKLNKKMQIIELKTQFKIFGLTLEARNQARKSGNSEHVFDNLTNKGQSVNPFLTMMYYKISFNTWLNAMRKHNAAELDPDGIGAKDETQKQLDKQVMIEVEEIVEYTSEEEDEEEEFNEPANTKSLFGGDGRSPTSSKRSGRLQRKSTMNNSSMKKSKRGMGSDMKTSNRKSAPMTEEKLK